MRPCQPLADWFAQSFGRAVGAGAVMTVEDRMIPMPSTIPPKPLGQGRKFDPLTTPLTASLAQAVAIRRDRCSAGTAFRAVGSAKARGSARANPKAEAMAEPEGADRPARRRRMDRRCSKARLGECVRIDEGERIGDFAGYVWTFREVRRLNQAPAPKFSKTTLNALQILRSQCYMLQFRRNSVWPRSSKPCLAPATKCACISGHAAPASKPELGQPPQRMPRRSLGGPPSRPPRPPQGPRSVASQRRWPQPCPRRRPAARPRRKQSKAAPDAASSPPAPDTQPRPISSPPPPTANGRPTSKPCSPPSPQKTMPKNNASPRSNTKSRRDALRSPWRERSRD